MGSKRVSGYSSTSGKWTRLQVFSCQKQQKRYSDILFISKVFFIHSHREILLEVKYSGEENIVIDCSYEVLEEVLKQCQQVGILSDRHRVIISNLVSALRLETYRVPFSTMS